MKAYMWRDNAGRWVYVLGHFRTVAEARERWRKGAIWGHSWEDHGISGSAMRARKHAARSDQPHRTFHLAA